MPRRPRPWLLAVLLVLAAGVRAPGAVATWPGAARVPAASAARPQQARPPRLTAPDRGGPSARHEAMPAELGEEETDGNEAGLWPASPAGPHLLPLAGPAPAAPTARHHPPLRAAVRLLC
jgi:hypothetical protein